MCDCITTIDALLEEQKSNTKVGVSMPYRQINGQMLFAIRANVETLKVEKSVRKKPTGVMATYCPFCGKKYQTFEEMAAEADLLARFPLHEDGAYTFWCPTCKGYAGFTMANSGSALGLAKACQQQEEQGNEVRYEAPGTDADYSHECQCNAEPEDEEEDDANV